MVLNVVMKKIKNQIYSGPAVEVKGKPGRLPQTLKNTHICSIGGQTFANFDV